MTNLLHNQVPPLFRLLVLVLLLFSTVSCQSEPTPPPTPALSVQEKLGKEIFSRECTRCHSLSQNMIIVGPSLAGIATLAQGRLQSTSAKDYLLQSIMRPEAYLVAGFEDLMPTDLGKKLTGEEVDGVVAYLLTLK